MAAAGANEVEAIEDDEPIARASVDVDAICASLEPDGEKARRESG